MMTSREKFISLLDTEQIFKSDAIVLLEGDGLNRYMKAVNLFNEGVAPLICFSGNFDDEKSGAYTYEKIRPLMLAESIREDTLYFEDKSKNTYEQAVEVIQIAKRRGWKTITIVASHYHSYRAFLTFLHEQQISYPDLLIDIAAVDYLDWYEETGYGRRVDLLEAEFEKIELYAAKGNVASYEEGIEYLKWKYQKRKK